MNDVVDQFEPVKISAFSKYARIQMLSMNSATDNHRPESQTTKMSVENSSVNAVNFQRTRIHPLTVAFETSRMLAYKLEDEIRQRYRARAASAIQKRRHIFENFTQEQLKKRKNWEAQQLEFIAERKRQELAMLNAVQATCSTSSFNHEQRSSHTSIAKQKERIQQYQQAEQIRSYQKEFHRIDGVVAELIRHHIAIPDLKDVLSECCKTVEYLRVNFKILLESSDTITEADQLKKTADFVVHISTVKQVLDECIQKYNINSSAATVTSTATVKPINPQEYLSKTNYKHYCEILEYHEKYCHSFDNLIRDVNEKAFIFECKKAVNIPVNTVSAVNSDHLRDKYVKLRNILAGNTILNRGRPMRLLEYPEAIAFCTDLLAKKFVQQGELIVSSSPESAFWYSRLILTLWAEFPDFGKILLAHFYKQCPYLVPFVPQKEASPTDRDYYASLGYKFNSAGEIEVQDKYLKRMVGVMRLYFALFVDKPGYEMKGQTDPLTAKDAWHWLVTTLKLQPQCDITATALHTFLDMTGFHLTTVYKKMFKRVVTVLTNEMLPQIRGIDCGGPLTRLEVLLESYQKDGFSAPKGVLPITF